MTTIGIHDLELASTHYVVDLGDLADSNGTDPAKYRIGLGQDEMSFPAPDEDIVTMAATAAQALLARTGTEGIRTVIFATESSIDQSKAAGVWVHQLLGLPRQVRVSEVKQACYAGTAALQTALGIVSRAPEERVLIVASDVARYELDSPGEPTQGAGAVAMLVSANPALLAVEPQSGLFTDDVDDFWRPNGSSTAVVDGRLSVSAYLDALTGAWDDLQRRGGPGISDISRMVYHQPFTKMARKAQQRLAAHTAGAPGAEAALAAQEAGLDGAAAYNRRLGNSYTASLYAGIASLLDSDDGLAGHRIGCFSYGSGSVSELFTAIVQDGYRERRAQASSVPQALQARTRIDIPHYRALHEAAGSQGVDHETERVTQAPFRYVGTFGQARRYERNES